MRPAAPVLVLFLAACAAHEPKASQSATLSQDVNDTHIAIAYDRPVARGRTLFGALVPFGQIWMPGANWATTIELSRDVLVQGRPLAAGKYSLWTIPGESAWTIIFSRRAHAFHTRYPAGEDALRVQARPLAGSHMETLAFYFPIVGPDSAILDLHWGETIVPLTIRTR